MQSLEDRTLLSSASLYGAVQVELLGFGVVMERWTVDAADAPSVQGTATAAAATGDFFGDGGGNLNGNGLQFNLIPASGMSQVAIDGFQAAADLWSSILTDDIIVNINIDFRTLGAGILGSAGSTTESMSLPTFRTSLTADATSLSDQTAVSSLPSGSSLSLYTSNATTGLPEIDNNGTGNNTVLNINTSVSRALGVRSAGSSVVDASITFSNSFTWDFDRSNGISAGAYDFIGVAAHEIGHALGFRSGADTVDVNSGNGPNAGTDLNGFRVVTALDLFRFSDASLSNGTDLDLRADTAPKYFSIDGGTTQIAGFSTGRYNGDGRQASHWKDNLGVGIMDPTAAPGEYADITNLDVMAMDVIGWDVIHDFGDAPDTGPGTSAGNYATGLSDDGPRHLLFSASGLITDPAGAATVYLGAGVDRDFDGQPGSSSNGDDNDGTDDENGISSFPNFVPGATVSLEVISTAGGAHLDYFFDFNGNGSFADPGESFSAVLNSTVQSVPVTVPLSATIGNTVARFRISSAGGLGPTGPAADGEVEDYQVAINAGGLQILVDTLADESDGDFSSGDLSLREAVEMANAGSGADVIRFVPGLSGGTITLTLAQLLVTDDLTIEGPGADLLTISGGDAFRVFDLQSAPDVTIDGLTISRGRTTGAGQAGGAIRSTGNLLLTNSVVADSSTTGNAADGGGIFQINGSLTLINSTVSGNSVNGAGSGGGGVWSTSGAVSVTSSTISGNSTAADGVAGGGILVASAGLSVTDSTVSDNFNSGAGSVGGGVAVAAGNLTISGSTISGNQTTGPAGGVAFDSNGNAVSASIVNSTVSGNSTSAGFGGGVATFNGTMNVLHSTLTANMAPAGTGSGLASYTDGGTNTANTVVLSSVIAGNTNSDVDNVGSGANTISSSGFNLIGSGNAGASFGMSSDVTGVINPLLGPLADNGGSTLTHALLPGSPAVGGGDSSAAVSTDQRGAGFARVVGGKADIGAFELQASNPAVSLSVDNANIAEGAGVATFTATLSTITGEDVTVSLTFSGTATLNSDYTRSGTQILIPAGSLTGTVTVTAVQDAVIDPAESVVIDISGVVNGTENGSQQATTVIDDDEAAAALTVVIAASSISEAAGTAATTVTVSRNTDTTGDLTVILLSSDTSEVVVPSPVVIPAGQSSVQFSIDAVDDPLVDGTQSVTLTASAAGHQDGTDTIDVTDDDVPTLTVDVVATSISEGAGTGATTVVITRNTDTSQPMTVLLSSSDTTEATIQQSAVIPAGQASVTVNLDAVNDVIVDGTVSVTITASTISGASSATVDTTFGTNGVVVTSLKNSLNPIRFDMELQPDGKILIIGQHPTITNTWRVIRLNPNGTYDSSFGTGGIVDTAFTGTSDGRPMAIEQLSDGRILVVGAGYASINAPVMARYTSSGALDPTFGTNGVLVLPNTYRVTTDAVVNPDGSIWTAGWSSGDSSQGFPLVRINVDGSIGTTTWTNVGASVLDYEAADQILRQPDGKIIVAGRAASGVFTVRFNSDGTIDTQYGNNGVSPVVPHPPSRTFQVTDIKLDAQGRIVITGATIVQGIGSRDSSFVARFNTDGTLDSTFATNGIWLSIPGTQTTLYDLELLPDGRMLLLGSVFVSGSGWERSIHRLTANGSLDTTFDGDGVQLLPSLPSVFEEIYSGVLQPDGKLLTYSERFENFRIERFNVSVPGITGSDTVDVTDDEMVPTLTVTISADSISEAAGVGAATATVTRDGDTGSALTVTLSSSDTSEASVPVSVTIAAGQTSAQFSIDAIDDDLLDGTQTVVINATATGHNSGTDSIDVLDDEVILLVDGDSTTPDSDPLVGTTWGRAFSSLRSALAAATARNTDGNASNDVQAIWVADGTYVPGPARNQSFNMVSNVAIYGGFQGLSAAEAEQSTDERVRSSAGRLSYSTVLSGDLNGNDDPNLTLSQLLTHSTRLDNSLRVVYASNATGVLLDGLTITGGTAVSVTESLETRYDGGAILAVGTSIGTASELTLNEVVISGNAAGDYGGGIAGSRAHFTITNSQIVGNIAANGGAVGDAIYNISSLRIFNSVIAGNVATSRGGAISSQVDSTIVQSTITDNLAAFGGGFAKTNGSSNITGDVVAENTIIAGNNAATFPDHAGQFLAGSNHNLIGVWEGTSAIGANSIAGTLTAPLDPGISDWTVRTDGMWGYYLLPGSPALDAGDNNAAIDPGGNPLTADFYGNTRIISGTVDIGAVEGSEAGTTGVSWVVQSLSNAVSTDGVLTFAEAFLAANTNQPWGDASAGSFANPDTIQFAAGLSGTISLAGTPLSIFGQLNIAGPGASQLIIDAAGLSQVVEVRPGADVELSDITLTNGASDVADPVTRYRYLNGGAIVNYGRLKLIRNTISDSSTVSYGVGGGIYDAGFLEVTDSVINGNTARSGGGLYSSGLLNVTGTSFMDNSVSAQGGGLFVASYSPTIAGSVFLHNSAYQGGAVYNAGAALTILDSSLLRNDALGGAAIYQNGTSTVLVGSTVSGNRASHPTFDSAGGGVYVYKGNVTIVQSSLTANSADRGGAVYTDPFDLGSVSIIQSLFVGNTGNISGGAVYVGTNSSVSIRNSTIVANSAGSGGGIDEASASGLDLNVRNSIIALNIANDDFDDVTPFNPFQSRHNLIGVGYDATGSLNGTNGHIVGTPASPVDPLFVRNPGDGGDGWGDNPTTASVDESANDDYGDLTLTLSSPALEAGDQTLLPMDQYDLDGDQDTSELLPVDFSGNVRVQNSQLDIGMQETSIPTLTVTIADAVISENGGATSATVTRSGDTSAALTVTLQSNDTTEATVPTTVTIPAGQASATFEISAVDDFDQDGTQTAVISAAATDYVGGQVSLDVTDDDVPPRVIEESVNDGDTNRSGIRSYRLRFDFPVTLAGASDLTLFNHTTSAWIDISTAVLSGNGTSSVAWDLSAISLPNGIYTAELRADRPLSGRLLATHVTQFHVLRGDVSGNLQVDFADIGVLLANFNTIGGLPFGPGDVDGNGDVDFADIGVLLGAFNQIYSPPEFDFGDAASGYPVRLADNGARHLLGSGLLLGSQVDSETDGIPTPNADGDDANTDDEDGVQFGNLIAGSNATVTVTAAVPAGMQVFVNGWMDLNQDGDWDDTGEQIILNQPVTNGVNSVTVSIPADAAIGGTMARIRLSSSVDISYFGLARDGEVEDYSIAINAPAPGVGQLKFAEFTRGDEAVAGFGFMTPTAAGGAVGVHRREVRPLASDPSLLLPETVHAVSSNTTATKRATQIRMFEERGRPNAVSMVASPAPVNVDWASVDLNAPLPVLDEGLVDAVFAEELGI